VQSKIDRVRGSARPRINPSIWAGAAGAVLVAGMAAAAGPDLTDARTRYEQDRAACIGGHTDRATCLREAGAAFDQAKHGRIGDDPSSYERNRLLRCDRLAAGEREDCLRRMRGEGTVSGSVEGGGIYRELRTTVPAQ